VPCCCALTIDCALTGVGLHDSAHCLQAVLLVQSSRGALGPRWCCQCLPVCRPAGFQQLAGGLLSSGQLLPYQESVVVDMLHKEVQRSMENQWQMARLETKRCVHSTLLRCTRTR
jgi:hypothetical protein